MEKKYSSSNGFVNFAGTHLIIELWEGRNFSSIGEIKKALKGAITACGATLLKIHLHKFSPYGGISGVAIIKESHVSIHSWPEHKYAAIDIFVCGEINPYKAIPVIKKSFRPKNIHIVEIKRGVFY